MTGSETKSSETTADQPAPDPAEVAHTTARLRVAHREEAGMLQHALDRLTAVVGWAGFVVILALTTLVWTTGNLVAPRLGFTPLDPFPFPGLEAVAAIGALLFTSLILTTQRHEDKLADHRAQLILELAIANDQKMAKIIALLEESRRDNPALPDRTDSEAVQMSTPSNTEAVLEAIKSLREDVV